MLENVPQLDAFSDLANRIINALLNDLRLVSVSLQQAWVEFRYRRRAHKYKVCFGKDGMDLFCTLNVYVKQSNQFLFFEFIELCLLRAIEICMDLAVLNKFISFNLRLESGMVHEMIVLPIDFSLTWRASCVGDTKSESFTILFENFIHQCSFSCTWRSNNSQRLEKCLLSRKMLIEDFLYTCTIRTFCSTYCIIDL